MTDTRRNAVRLVLVAVLVLALVGGFAALRHVDTLDEEDTAVIEDYRERNQGEYRVVVDGQTVRVRDSGGEVVLETTTRDWRENREEYEQRFDLGEPAAQSGSGG